MQLKCKLFGTGAVSSVQCPAVQCPAFPPRHKQLPLARTAADPIAIRKGFSYCSSLGNQQLKKKRGGACIPKKYNLFGFFGYMVVEGIFLVLYYKVKTF